VPSLSLFSIPTPERAWELVARFPLGGRLDQHAKSVAGLPYYRVCYGRRKVWLGDDAKRKELEAAWRIVAAEIAAATPRELAELEKRAGVVKTHQRSREVPIIGIAK
jgi:hypothetical protein